MKFPDFFQVVVYDATDGPSANEYIFYVRFEAHPGRHWNLSESEIAARWWAEKLIQLDGSQLPEVLNRMRYFAKPVDERQVIKTGRAFQMGAGITIWVEMAPPGSQLKNEIAMRMHTMMLRSQVSAQVEAMGGSSK